MNRFLLLAGMALLSSVLSAQVAVKNNLLYDAALTPNVGFELRTSPKWTVGLGLGYSPFQVGTQSTRRWRHLLVMPEARYWFCQPYARGFVSFNAVYSRFNAAELDLPLYGTGRYRYQGDFLGFGASYGWAIPFGRERRWNLELEAGADVAYAWYDRYLCEHCGTLVSSGNKPFLLPKLAISVAYLFPDRLVNKDRAYACSDIILQNIPWIAPEPEPVVVKPRPQLRATGAVSTAEVLRKDNPFLNPYKDYRPYDETRILRKESNALYVYFPLSSTTLSHDFRDNAPILDRIVGITAQVMQDSTSRVHCIQIIGLASIEGSVKGNCALGEGRAQALKRYIQERVPTPDSLYEVANGCEAWSEFRDQICDLQILKGGGRIDVEPGTPTAATIQALTPEVLAGITEKEIQALLEIIDTEPDANRREQRIRRMNGGRTYQYLKRNVLADQRNSGYIRVFYDVVPDEAAAAINDAAGLVRQQQYAQALERLQPWADDPRAQNTLGVALYMTDRRDEAIAAFRRAADGGDEQARQNLLEIEKTERQTP